ncbi:MAG: TRAP transporter substrate-binding protein DctP [Desulfobacterales bacterium]|nr:TRAP transporter substrate-binding protein DctP [Desulfobacterales bacterium]
MMTAKHLRALLLIGVALVMTGTFATSTMAADKPIEIVLSTYMPTSYGYLVQPLQDFAKNVEAESGGRVKFKFYHSGQLYKGKEEFGALERGDIDMAAPNDLYLTGIVPELGISNLPFLWDSPASMQRTIDAGLWDLGINQKMLKHQVVVLGAAAGGPYQIYSKNFEVTSPDHLKGKKWGVSGSTASKAMALMGGSPTTMGSGELYMALQRGTIDGTTRPLITGLGRKLYEVVEDLSVTNMAYFTIFLGINKDKWDSLPADIQDIMKKASKQRSAQQLEMLEVFMKDAIRQYNEKGVKVHVATPAELAVFQERMKPVYDWWIEKVPDGQKFIEFARTHR